MPLDEKKEKAEISGNTLLVYWYLLKNREGCGVREIQRALGFSSSSSAHYHLDKLEGKGILIKDNYGTYKINNRAKIGLINPFIIVHGFVFPKQLLYAVATSIMCIFFVAFFWKVLTLTIVLALSPGVVASIIFWYDTIKLWKSLPPFKRSVR